MTRKVKAALVLALAAGIGLIVVPGASAEWVFKEKLGEHTTEPSFSRAAAMVVDPVNGDILVVDSTAQALRRFKPNGEPDPFSALGTNVIDGKGPGADETPQDALEVSSSVDMVQVAIAPPNSANAGDIYVAQEPIHLVSIFAPTGEYLGQLTQFNEGAKATGGAKALTLVGGVSVDSAGAVYVSDLTNNEIHKYVPKANPVTNANNSANFSFPNPSVQVAGAGPSAGTVFARNRSSKVVERLNASKNNASSGEEECEAASGVRNLALNSENGALLANLESGNRVLEFDGGCPANLLSNFEPGFTIFSIAVDGAHSLLYVSRASAVLVYREIGLGQAKTLPAAPVGLTSATLNGEVKPNGAPLTECFCQWGETASYGHTLPCAEYESGGTWHPIFLLSELGTGSAFTPVRAQISTGLKVGSAYHFQLRAANANNAVGETAKGGDKEFLTLGPSLAAEAAAEVGEESATLFAKIDPNSKLTTYQAQYVTEAEFEATGWAGAKVTPVTPVAVGEGSGFSTVSQHISGLAPGTAYRFRFVAENPDGANEGLGARFTTFPITIGGLLDGRAYELVTPAAKKGEPIPPEPDNELGGSCDPVNPCFPGAFERTQPIQVSPEGNSILYSGQPFAAGLASGKNTYLSARTSSGWNWGSLSPRIQTGTWEAFSTNLSRGVLAQTEPPLSPEAPVRGGLAFANLYLRDRTGHLTPLITTEPPNRDPGGGSDDFNINFAAANAGTTSENAFENIIFEANDALTIATTDAPEAPPVKAGECASPGNAGTFCDLYEWSGSHLSLVNVAPGNGASFGEAVLGSGRLLERNKTYEAPSVDNAISADGHTIFWTSEETGQAYARIDGNRTLEVPGPATCKASVSISSRACFLTASKDGTEVLLSNGELFERNAAGTAYVPREDLTKSQGGFEGYLATGEEGGNITRVYFADPKALSGTAAHEEAGHVNLYYWHDGALRFVASLLEGDNSVARGFGDWRAAEADRTAQATSDGRYLTFMSRASLTGYDNIRPPLARCSANDANSVCTEVFEYAAAAGTLVCPSCNPTGEVPLGASNLTRLWVGVEGAPDFGQVQNLPAEGEGRIFFESQDALSPQDHNGHIQDVYEWEPKGVGDCASEEAEGGCLRLISSGRSETDSAFVGATPSGDDAFFITRSKLLPADKNEQLDLYDARAPHVPGEVVGFPEEAKPTPCEGEACLGAASESPSLPGAGSATFTGSGNPPAPKAPCPKGKVRKGGKCVKKAKSHKKQKHIHGRENEKSRRANHDRRPSR